MLFKQQANDELRRVDQIAQVGKIGSQNENVFRRFDPEEQNKIGKVHNHGDGAAEILPEKFMREGELAEHLKLEKAAGHEDQHQHKGLERHEEGHPPEIGDPDALRIKVRDRQTGKEDEELDRRENRLRGRPLGRIPFFKLFRSITRHDG